MSGGGGESIASKITGMSPLQSGKNLSMPAYGSKTASPSASQYSPTYAPMQQNPEQAIQNMGLEALYQSMASQYAPISQQFNSLDQFYQQPMQQRQMPEYKSSALNYRPDMSGITANLSRVAPSVQLQQQRAAEAAAAEAAAKPQTNMLGGGLGGE
jgi:hypothetical protein